MVIHDDWMIWEYPHEGNSHITCLPNMGRLNGENNENQQMRKGHLHGRVVVLFSWSSLYFPWSWIQRMSVLSPTSFCYPLARKSNHFQQGGALQVVFIGLLPSQ